ncbi:MBL fold metallo-hydrolase [Aureimonas frigidaquae]|uniref:MBL fold metallo-hydrolase n=1 Tax=Aureimonas frigidaquae TaxID=424757 RepID=UPI0007814864|nr:MBL fold metallo-hydrolase [Aureimonas frigidaquae]
MHASLKAFGLLAGILFTTVAVAQEPVSSTCLAMANAMPAPIKVAYAQAPSSTGIVEIAYAGHSTYRIETPEGVTIATDYSGIYGSEPLPMVVTMNKAHRTHYTDRPDPGIAHVLRGWGDRAGAPARHALTVGDVLIRNVTTDIRRWGTQEPDANSIFIFEVAGLCIGHLGHLHHALEDRHYAAIGRLDVVMVPVDGGLTATLATMGEITGRLSASVVLPMHRQATGISEFTDRLGGRFDIVPMDGNSLTLSARDLPRRPTVFIPAGL